MLNTERRAAIFIFGLRRSSSRRAAEMTKQQTVVAVQALPGEEPVFLSKKEVLARIPITAPTLWHWSRTENFPQPRYIGARTVWLKHEVEHWMRSRPMRTYKGAGSK
jgi:predicted DNA-binding transcriptional regulator AlpA